MCVSCTQERNVRIAKIVGDLKLPDLVVDPSLNSYEDPEQLLVVDPSEVKVDKYISEEEAKRLEEEARVEEEKKAAERVSPWLVSAVSRVLAVVQFDSLRMLCREQTV